MNSSIDQGNEFTDSQLLEIPSDNIINFQTSISFYKDKGWDVTLLFQGTNYSEQDIENDTLWLNPFESHIITKNFFRNSLVFLSHKSSYNHSITLTKLNPIVRNIIKYTPFRILINNVHKTVDKLENSFDYDLKHSNRNKFSLKITPKPYKKRFLVGHEPYSSKGYLDSMFKLKGIKIVKQRVVCVSSDLERVINFFYKDRGFSYSSGQVYYNGELFASRTRALLIPELLEIGNWEPSDYVYQVHFDVELNGEIVFTKGEIYNAPYSYIDWESQGHQFQKFIEFFTIIQSRRYRELDRLIEENNRKAKSLMRLSVQIEEEKKNRTHFLANIVHEIKTPLSSIVMLVESISEHLVDIPDFVSDGLNDLSCRSERLTRFVDNVMSFFNLENESFNLKLESIDLAFLLNDVLDNFICSQGMEGIRIQSTVTPDRYIVNGDFFRLTQVFLNIIGNSIKFTSHGTIHISAGFKNEFLYIEIKDSGVGISKEEIPFIFNKFRSSEKSNKNGIGLGLYISKMLTEYHNGYITVESTKGVGSSFKVFLPTYICD